jgi:hypothetical protein
MRSIETIALSVLLSLAAGSTAFADVQFSLRDGRVSIVAKDATIAEILAVWAKVGQATIINAERLPHDRVTLELTNVGEQQALDVLLRAVSGYLAAPRAIPVASASQFDRIFVMPPSVAPRPTSAAVSAANVSAPAYHAPPLQNATYETPADPPQSDAAEPQHADDSATETNDADDEQPTFATMAGAIAPPSPSVQKTFASRRALETMDPREFKLPSGGAVAGTPARGAQPSGGVAVPGMLVQPTMPPRQPGVSGQPLVIRQ